MTAPTVLSIRDLNRATLARQLLVERVKLTPPKAIERLAGLQAQLARPPYLALWSRLAGFTRDQLTTAALRREVVRATTMRGTIHLLSAADYRTLRPALQPALDKGLKSVLRDRLDGIDVPAVLKTAKTLFADKPKTFDALRTALVARFPKTDERAMAYAARLILPLVMVPVEGTDWGWPGAADFALADSWLDTPIDIIPGAAVSAEPLVLRYLAAFGPATVTDAQIWSGLPNLRSTFEALRPRLVVFRDERKRELFDLPKAPRPGGDAPVALVRFLPEFDNLLLSHDDRTRVFAAEHRSKIMGRNLVGLLTFMVDGFVAGNWKLTRKKNVATLELMPFAPVSKKIRAALEEEGDALVAFIEPSAKKREVR